MRLEDLLAAHALRSRDKTALVAGMWRTSYGELHASVLALANGMHRIGVRPGDRVLVYLPNGVEFAQTLYAVFALGAIVVPVNTRMAAKEVAYFAADSRPVLIVHHVEHDSLFAELGEVVAGMARVVVGANEDVNDDAAGVKRFESLIEPCDLALPEVPLDTEDCMILYTSGTTGQPKGALITHANLIVQHAFLNAIEWRVSGDDTFLVTTPLAHRTGLARMLNALCLGATLVAMKRFDVETALSLIDAEAVTALGMVPTVARMLMPAIEREPSRCRSLRHVIVTGEAFPVELKARLIELLPQVRLHSFFAMTEVGSVTSLEHQEQFTHPASVGRVTPGVQVKLVDERGDEVAVGEAGELLVRSGEPGRFTTMRGYFERPDATAEAIVDGWVRTGDMARFDVDGYLYIVDRKKDMVLSGGFNIYTKEVERALLEHDAIADCAVVGVPDELFGEAVTAFVQVKAGRTLGVDDLLEHSRMRIASYKKPRHVFFVRELPRNALGKVLKTELRTQAVRELEARLVSPP